MNKNQKALCPRCWAVKTMTQERDPSGIPTRIVLGCGHAFRNDAWIVEKFSDDYELREF